MPKNKNDYFKLIEQQVSYCVEASTLLSEILCNYTASSIPHQRDKIHMIKEAADEQYQNILSRLLSEFITPIEQEDILHLTQILNDITDALNKVVIHFYMYNVNEIPPYVPNMSRVVDKCVRALYDAIKELKNIKKPVNLSKLLIAMNCVKSEADVIYIGAIHSLYLTEKDSKKLISHKEIYQRLEDCCEQCERVANIMEQIIIKNT